MPNRRELIIYGAATLALVPIEACRRAASRRLSPGAVRIPMADLPDGGRLAAMRYDEPIELRRSGTSIVARSMFCTHFGCRVAWDASSSRYLCPCHGGVFDEEGKPIGGPPTEALRILPVEVDGEWLIVLPRP